MPDGITIDRKKVLDPKGDYQKKTVIDPELLTTWGVDDKGVPIEPEKKMKMDPEKLVSKSLWR